MSSSVSSTRSRSTRASTNSSQTVSPKAGEELRHLIRTRVTSKEIQGKIKECVDELKDREGGGDEQQVSLLKLIEKKGLIEEIMAGLKIDGDKKDAINQQHSCILSKHLRHLSLRILHGKAFIDYIQALSEPIPVTAKPTFTLHVYFGHQRYTSSAVPCSCEPEFNELFLFELSDLKQNDSADLLTLSDMIHIILTKTTLQGETNLVGTFLLDWRPVLSSSSRRINKSIELLGPKADGRIAPGILVIECELLPPITGNAIDKKLLQTQCQLEHQRENERKRLFLLYAKQWWAEFLSSRSPTNAQRLVKIFAEDERGQTHFVCHYISPLKADRLLESPHHAARFVSLIDYKEMSSNTIGEEAYDDSWQTMMTFLSTKSGSCPEHSILLCSLLLGYGLDAYVCIGTKVKGLPHSWVMTSNKDGSVTFWESLTGQRFHQSVHDPDVLAGTVLSPPTHPYRTIGCVFNHNSFYANNQPSDSVFICHFNLNNKSFWKRLSSDAVSLTGQLQIPPLMASTIDSTAKAIDLEKELKILWTQHRIDCGLTTQWDQNLSYLLGPPLYSYELERREGISVGLEEFQESVRRYVPEGHTFKGFPMQFSHLVGHKIFLTCLKSPMGGDIINCHGDCIKLALHVKVYTYPENICAVWCMLAVTYQSIV